MKPTGSKLLVKVEEVVVKEGEEKRKGNEVMTAKVLRIGPMVAGIIVGDRVVFSPFGFDEVEVNNSETGIIEKLVIVDEALILAVYEK